ncbi:MAG: ABC transporter ATP-binding protein [Bryobacteraceae bacterium]
MATDYALEAESLSKVYHSRWSGRDISAVSDLTLCVPQGIKFGLLGPNGAGKTTFVKMLLSAVIPTSGTARIFGQDARSAEARRPVGYLPENHRFPTYLSGSGMLDFYGALSGLSLFERKTRVPELLKLVGLEGWGDVRIKKYSKGMLQRLGLAQALIHRPRLLILDEPTDGVDPVGRRDIRDILNGLTGTGVTVFINSHLLAEVESFCDHVAILHRGKLALQGQISALVAGKGFAVTASRLPETVIASLQDCAAAVGRKGAGTVEVRLESLEAANDAIDTIRAAGGLVESVSNENSSLEEVFIQATRREQAA